MANPQVTLEVCVTASILRFFRLPPSRLDPRFFPIFSSIFRYIFHLVLSQKSPEKNYQKFHENKLKEKIHQKSQKIFFVFLITKKLWISLGKMFMLQNVVSQFIFNFYIKLNFQYCWSRLTFSMNSFLWSGISLSVLAN